MRLIDADELKEILDHAVFHECSNEYYGTMEAIERAPQYKLPPEQTTQSDDRWYRGYAAGWNAYRKEVLDNDPV